MSSIYLEVKFVGGTDIEQAAREACELADRLGITIDFKFNDVRCMAHPDGDPLVLVHNWRLASFHGGSYPMASTHPVR